MIGNFIADFVKGKQALEQYPLQIQAGIVFHRQIDQFTDTHPVTHSLVALLRPKAQRYAPVVIDIVYDHFLAKNFGLFFTQEVSDFANHVYEILGNNIEKLPPKLQEMFPYMRVENWLVRYGDGFSEDFYGLRRSLEGLQRRSLYAPDLLLCIDILKNNYEEFNQKSNIFLKDMQIFAENYVRFQG